MSSAKRGIPWLVAVLILSTTFGVRGQNPFPKTTFYQIHVRSFYDTDGDGLGDLNGIRQKLDYLEDLGIGALWIMPVFQANTPHKYFAADFMQIDPEYGTNEDMKQLIEDAHERGMSVMIDFSINHADKENLWFQKALTSWVEGEAASVQNFQKYFHFVHDKSDFNPECFTAEGVFQEDFMKNYESITTEEGMAAGFYYARFLDAPDFNYDHAEVRKYFLEVARYWVQDIGVDGLRLDAARHVYDVESPSPVATDMRNYSWWSTFCDEIHLINPEVYLLGEIWSNQEVMGSYLSTGMDATFNFTFSTVMLDAVKSGHHGGLVNQYLSQMRVYEEYASDFGDATFLINHDMKRLKNELEFDERKVRLAVSLLLTLPGSPFIYYGEELGFEADWPLLWLPMLWNDPGVDPGQCEWIFGQETIKQGILTTQYARDAISDFEPFSRQVVNKRSLFYHYRTLLRLRRDRQELGLGEIRASTTKDDQIVSFLRRYEGKQLLVIHNLSSNVKVISVDIPEGKFTTELYASSSIDLLGAQLELPAYGSVVLVEDNGLGGID